MDFILNFWSFQAYFLSYNSMFDPELKYILLGPFSAFSDIFCFIFNALHDLVPFV